MANKRISKAWALEILAREILSTLNNNLYSYTNPYIYNRAAGIANKCRFPNFPLQTSDVRACVVLSFVVVRVLYRYSTYCTHTSQCSVQCCNCTVLVPPVMTVAGTNSSPSSRIIIDRSQSHLRYQYRYQLTNLSQQRTTMMSLLIQYCILRLLERV